MREAIAQDFAAGVGRQSADGSLRERHAGILLAGAEQRVAHLHDAGIPAEHRFGCGVFGCPLSRMAPSTTRGRRHSRRGGHRRVAIRTRTMTT